MSEHYELSAEGWKRLSRVIWRWASIYPEVADGRGYWHAFRDRYISRLIAQMQRLAADVPPDPWW